MTDVLIYWRDYRQNWADRSAGEIGCRWHSNAGLFMELVAGDRLWLVTAGKNLDGTRQKTPQAGFLVGVWQVRLVLPNPGDDPAYPPAAYRYRVVADASASYLFDEPVQVDGILRPVGREKSISIGRFLQGPRKLKDEKVRRMRAAAGPQMARQYLTGRQAGS